MRASSDPQQRLMSVVPVTLLVILVILYVMFHSMKWALLMMASLSMAPLGGLLALLITGTHFSVSSGVGFLALFGVCVQTGVIMIDYINQLRAAGHPVQDAAVDGAILRLRPILMTTLVATLGLLPAALSHGIGIGSDSSPAPVRDRDRGRPYGLHADQHLSPADALRLDGDRRRRAAGPLPDRDPATPLIAGRETGAGGPGDPQARRCATRKRASPAKM